MAELADIWWAGRQHLKASTLDRDAYTRARVVEKWGTWQIGAIRPSHIQAWVSGMGKSGGTVRTTHNFLSQILDVAVADGLILSNPAHGVKLPKKKRPRKNFPHTPTTRHARHNSRGKEQRAQNHRVDFRHRRATVG
ncbi:hypothetical protein [Corynebacterium pseudotuberculosis]|uniref:hypothetical protein n=1 Tax=Corynebacterium pseudotuberculosis TaxID=1719 RepID=UPI000ADEFB29|nr:hypothetical protein [Corynebacterium pseudotuberculosis]